jgi:phage shock protein PspC (stress-responsive transcriptional regulator)
MGMDDDRRHEAPDEGREPDPVERGAEGPAEPEEPAGWEQPGGPEEPAGQETPPAPEEPAAREQPAGRGQPAGREQPRGPKQPAAREEPAGPQKPAGPQEKAGPEEPDGPQEPAAREQPGSGEPHVEEPTREAPTQPLGAGARSEPRRLLRSRSNRVIGGVCGGLGRYFNVDPIFFRIAAIALTLIGGAGLLLYVAALVLMPNEPDGVAAEPPPEGRSRALVIALVVVALLIGWPFLLGGGLVAAGVLVPLAFLVAAGVLVWWLVSGEGPSGDAADIARRAALGIGVIVLCLLVAIGGAWAAAAGGGTVVAILVIGAGLVILAGAFLKPVRWLILPAVVLALSAGAIAAADIDLDGGVGDEIYRPASAAALDDRYELGIGQLEVDLRDTDLPAGDTPLALDVGVGEARLLVREDVCVATDADVGVGAVQVFDRDTGGVDVDVVDRPDAAAETTRLVVDADVGVGALNVVHDPDDIDHRDDRFGPDFDADSDGSSLTAGNAACLDTGASGNG